MRSTASPAPQVTRAIGVVNFPAVAEIIDADGGLIVWDAEAQDNALVFSAEAATARVLDIFTELYG